MKNYTCLNLNRRYFRQALCIFRLFPIGFLEWKHRLNLFCYEAPLIPLPLPKVLSPLFRILRLEFIAPTTPKYWFSWDCIDCSPHFRRASKIRGCWSKDPQEKGRNRFQLFFLFVWSTYSCNLPKILASYSPKLLLLISFFVVSHRYEKWACSKLLWMHSSTQK